MSVLVDMEMPKRCDQCTLENRNQQKCLMLNGAFTSDYRKAGRRKDCPIICELPKKHGRLIDAEELHELVEYHNCIHKLVNYRNCVGGYYYEVQKVIFEWVHKMIDAMITKVPAEGEE